MSNRLAEPLNFDDPVLEVPVTVQGVSYTLREASGAAAVRFVNARTESFRYSNTGDLIGFRNVGDLAPMLVASCLFDSGGRPVKKSDVEKWSNRIQESLYNRALDISNLREVGRVLPVQIKEAFEREGSPISFEDLKAFVETLDPYEFKDLRAIFRASIKEQEKNSENDTTDGSS